MHQNGVTNLYNSFWLFIGYPTRQNTNKMQQKKCPIKHFSFWVNMGSAVTQCGVTGRSHMTFYSCCRIWILGSHYGCMLKNQLPRCSRSDLKVPVGSWWVYQTNYVPETSHSNKVYLLYEQNLTVSNCICICHLIILLIALEQTAVIRKTSNEPLRLMRR